MKDKISGGISVLYFLESVHEDVLRIIDLVQENNWFFDIRPGGSCVAAAADKLEKLIEEAKK